MPARVGGDRPGAGGGAGREPHVEAVDAEARLADHRGSQPERGARAHRQPDGELLRLAPRTRPSRAAAPARLRPRGRSTPGPSSTSRPGRSEVSTATATTTSASRTSSTRTLRRRRGGIAERRAAQPAQHDEHEEEHRLGDDRPPVAGRPELRDSGQLDEGAGEARAGDQHHGGQREEGEPPDGLLVLPASQQQDELEDAAGPEGGCDDVNEVRRDRDRPAVPGPIRVAGEGRGEEQRQREDEGRCDQLRPGAREGGEQDAGERHDHRDLRDPLEARRRALCGVDEPGAAERDGEQGNRHRRRRAGRTAARETSRKKRAVPPAIRMPPRRSQRARTSRTPGRVEAGASTERGAPAPAAAAPTRKASTPDSR